jgi:hypothetical protein
MPKIKLWASPEDEETARSEN